MGNSLGDCGCSDAKDAIKGGPSAPKQQHVGVPPTTKVEDDAVVVGPDRAIQALIKSYIWDPQIEEMRENHRQGSSGGSRASKQEKPKNEERGGSSLSQGRPGQSF
ncbi:unnamed protein product [Prunus armeniaca]|uniref:Uncharacterized protein n=1 Tax=Prunus armeniaca TaxID=36596 RepID=A0A6J5WCK4_PRUAR|nr:unnamed protein product [Prunus armeniaca]